MLVGNVRVTPSMENADRAMDPSRQASACGTVPRSEKLAFVHGRDHRADSRMLIAGERVAWFYSDGGKGGGVAPKRLAVSGTLEAAAQFAMPCFQISVSRVTRPCWTRL